MINIAIVEYELSSKIPPCHEIVLKKIKTEKKKTAVTILSLKTFQKKKILKLFRIVLVVCVFVALAETPNVPDNIIPRGDNSCRYALFESIIHLLKMLRL